MSQGTLGRGKWAEGTAAGRKQGTEQTGQDCGKQEEEAIDRRRGTG